MKIGDFLLRKNAVLIKNAIEKHFIHRQCLTYFNLHYAPQSLADSLVDISTG